MLLVSEAGAGAGRGSDPELGPRPVRRAGRSPSLSGPPFAVRATYALANDDPSPSTYLAFPPQSLEIVFDFYPVDDPAVKEGGRHRPIFELVTGVEVALASPFVIL